MSAIGRCSTCPTCPTCSSAVETGDLRCAVCGTSVPRTVGAPSQKAHDILRCRDCHAALRYDANQAAPACGFCGDVLEVETQDNPPEGIGHHLPFAVTQDQARTAVREWLGTRGFFCPPDVRTEATVDSVKALWWVGWSFDVDAQVSWTADSNAGAGRAKWAPHAGQMPMQFRQIVLSASRGLTEPEAAALVPSYRMDTEVSGVPDAEGVLVEEFDLDRAGARDRVTRAIQHISEGQIRTSGTIPGRKFRKVHVDPMVRGLSTKRFAFPAYVLAYRYRNKLYRTVVNGQNPTCVHGDSPLSMLRIAAVVAAGVALIAVFIAIVSAG